VSTGFVKELFDSCYLRPDQNQKVIQDTDPAKHNALEQAKLHHLKKIE
jgi:hypothetical protein